MACQEIHTWTLSTLVGSFLDLALAYLFLCGSALAFLASKFLNLFGLCLPCPCDGLFGDPSADKCLQRLLVDYPTGKISAVQMSVRTKFPYNSMWASNLNVKLLRNPSNCGGYSSRSYDHLPEMEGEASCSSVSDARKPPLAVTGPVGRLEIEYGNSAGRRYRSALKGKGPNCNVRRRRRASFSDRCLSNGKGKEMDGESSFSVNSGVDHQQRDAESPPTTPPATGLLEETLPHFDVESHEVLLENEVESPDFFSAKERLHESPGSGGNFDDNSTDTIKLLEQALEEEQAARAALYLELDAERNAAASAADEAMRMILRLQKEKAKIEMEARQYQRVIEEKYAYDEEEMDILKEILVRREREKLVLEKEVEVYRQMMFFEEKKDEAPMMFSHGRKYDFDDTLEVSGQRANSSFDSADDPMLILQRISESIEKEGTVKGLNLCLDAESCWNKHSGSSMLETEGPLQYWDDRVQQVDKHHPDADLSDERNLKFQEKGMVSKDEEHWVPQLENNTISCKSNKDQELIVNEKWDEEAVCREAKPVNQDRVDGPRSALSLTSQFEAESSVIDVHVIDDESKIRETGSAKEGPSLSDSSPVSSCRCDVPLESYRDLKPEVLSDHSSTNMVEAVHNIPRCSSDTTSCYTLQHKASLSAFRRNSMSAADYERLKIETEVGRLRERLKAVQQGREKLSFSMEDSENENSQELQLPEEIASLLQEIRSLTQPGMTARRVSLPPPSSKANTKKRRCRSVSVHESAD